MVAAFSITAKLFKHSLAACQVMREQPGYSQAIVASARCLHSRRVAIDGQQICSSHAIFLFSDETRLLRLHFDIS
jgi:hypothetical protein